MVRWGPGCSEVSNSRVDGCWMEVACDWDICKAKMSKMPQKMLGELFRMDLNSAVRLLAKLGWGLGVLGAWGANLGEGGL